MAHYHDVNRFWTSYHRMKGALEKIGALDGPGGEAARRAALRVLEGGTYADDLAPEGKKLVMEVFAGLDGAERAVCGSYSEGGVQGSPSDRVTDEQTLAELVSEWRSRLGSR